MRPLRLNIIPSFLSLVAVPSLLLWGKLRCFCCCCCCCVCLVQHNLIMPYGLWEPDVVVVVVVIVLLACCRPHRCYITIPRLSLSLSLLSFPLSSRAHSSRVRVRPRSNEYIKTLVYKAHITIALSSPFCLAGIQLNTEILYIQKERERKRRVCV